MAAISLMVAAASLFCTMGAPHSQPLTFDRARFEEQMQQVLDEHSRFWNVSMSFAIYNDTVEAAVASGPNNYQDPRSKLTVNTSIPMGSTTKMYSAVAVLRFVKQGLITLDQPVAPLVDKYLAVQRPCAQAPSWCSSKCFPIASCITSRGRSDDECAHVTPEIAANCSYCLHYLHCCDAPSCPSAATLKGIWGSETIEKVTFRHLLGMQSGIQDYYYDRTNWLMREVMSSTRDVEPLEYLLHLNKTFLFEPGSGRASYSTDGFSLVGLALAGLLNLTDWAQLDQRKLAWGDHLFPDDQTLFPTRGTCSKDPRIARQYTSTGDNQPFYDMTDTSCLNSWLGGNVAARPLDVARFAHQVFTKRLIDEAGYENMTKLHEVTDGFAAGMLAYGLGLEASWNGGKPGFSLHCGLPSLGHEGLDYGSGSTIAAYIPAMKLGVTFAMTSGCETGSVMGMNCSLRYDSLLRAPQIATNSLLNLVMKEVVGIKPSCPVDSYEVPAASTCQDAPSFGRFDLFKTMTCAQVVAEAVKKTGVKPSMVCRYFSYYTLAMLKGIYRKSWVWYVAPSGYDPDTTLAVDLCKDTCGALGSGKCWLRGARQPWCTPAQSNMHDFPIII